MVLVLGRGTQGEDGAEKHSYLLDEEYLSIALVVCHHICTVFLLEFSKIG